MFKLGAIYEIVLRENGHTTYNKCEVVAVEMPLIKVKQFGKEFIINTASLAFVRARIED